LGTSLQKSVSFLSATERRQLLLLTVLRVLTSLFDLVALALVGLMLRLTTSDEYWPKLDLTIFSYTGKSIQFEKFIILLASSTLILFLGKSYISAVLSRKTSNCISLLETRITSRLLGNLISLKNYKYSTFSIHELQNAVVLSATSAFTYLLVFAINLVTEAFLLLAIAALFFIINPALTFALLIYFGLIGLFIQKKLGKEFRKNGDSLNASIVATQEQVADTLNIRSEINFLKVQGKFIESFKESRTIVSSSNGNLMYLNSLPRYIIEASMLIGVALVTIIVFVSGASEDAAGTVGIFLAGSLRMMASMLPLQSAVSSIKQHSTQSSLFFKVAEDFNLKESESVLVLEELENSESLRKIQVDQISKVFEGSPNPALNKVSFEINSPCFAAFIGPSGSGKSTLIEIMLGILEPTSGKVNFLTAGKNSMNRTSVKFGYVPQIPKLIHGTLRSNILLSKDFSTQNNRRLQNAIESAQLSDLVDSLPQGLETVISPQGNNFSGGQIQRIGIARALVGDPDVLVLDEATSALDAETEAAISKSLFQISRQTTVIAIAHRMATIQSADVVFFLLDGNIKASGTLTQLAKSEPTVNQYIQHMKISEIDS
jgi:ABC-type multidrug transport system fused ATPase/permease subunit